MYPSSSFFSEIKFVDPRDWCVKVGEYRWTHLERKEKNLKNRFSRGAFQLSAYDQNLIFGHHGNCKTNYRFSTLCDLSITN